MERSLIEILPILGVEHDSILSKQGDITVGFDLILPEIFSLSNEEFESFHQSWIKAIKVLPKHTIFHKQDWFLESKYAGNFENDNIGFLSRSSERFFNERPFLNHRSLIFITKKPYGRKLSSSVFSNLLRKSIVPEQALSQELLRDFLDNVDQFARILMDSGFVRLIKLQDDKFISQPHNAGIIEKYCFLYQDENLFIKDISFKDEIRIGKQFCQLFTLSQPEDLPSFCGPRINYDKYSTDKTKFPIGYGSTLGLPLTCNHIYNQYIFLSDPSRTIKELEAKKLRLQSLSAYSRENSISKDAINDFLNEAVGQQRLPVKAHFNILIWAEQRDRLKEIRNLVSSALAQIDSVPKQELDGAPQIYWAGIPGNEADFPMNDTFDSFLEQACCFLNLEANYFSSTSPVGIRLGDRLTGKPVHVDISDEPRQKGITTNRNKFILGPTGSGKSFFTNHLLRSYYDQGSHVVVVDVGHSYQGLCKLVGGYYFTYSEQTPICFNPFFLPNSSKADTEKRESIKTLLLALWKRDDENHSRSEYVALSNALQLYYQYLQNNLNVFPCFNTFYEFAESEYRKILKKENVRENDFNVDNFLYVLRPYYKGGEFDYLLNATNNLDLLDQRFIVFELDNIKDHPILFPVVTIILMEMFISKMRKLKGIRKVLLLEEVWKALMQKGMENAILYWVKTIRKFFGELLIVTQDVEDVIGSKIVKNAIINNSDCKILLDQSKFQNRFDPIQELLGLTEKEKSLALSVNKSNDPTKKYKEVFISLGGSLAKVYRTEVSPEEYFAYTTEETEKIKVQEYSRRFDGDIERGIKTLLNEN